MATLVAVIALAVAIAIWGIYTHNRLARLTVRAEEAWREIDTQLKRRWDLIPNLVEAVRGYASHEESVFTRVTDARTRALDAETPGDRAAAEEGVKDALFSLFAIAEEYPELRANENFLTMQETLVDAEDRIRRARQYYNAVVRELNLAVLTFPRMLIAGMFRFEPRDFYALPDENMAHLPKVQL